MSPDVFDVPDRAGRGVVRSASPLMSVHVLVIDDDVRLFEVLDSYLTQNGVRSTHALQRAFAGLFVPSSPGAFDAVLLDIMMPGHRRARRAQEDPRQRAGLPVIMLTAKGDETDRVVGLELGADDYLGKPFSPRELLGPLCAPCCAAPSSTRARST